MSPKARVVASNSQGYRDDAFPKVINRIRREECFIIGNEFFNQPERRHRPRVQPLRNLYQCSQPVPGLPSHLIITSPSGKFFYLNTLKLNVCPPINPLPSMASTMPMNSVLTSDAAKGISATPLSSVITSGCHWRRLRGSGRDD